MMSTHRVAVVSLALLFVGSVAASAQAGPRSPATRSTGAIVYDSHGHLYAINPNGTGRRELTRRGNAIEPAWSPDGREIAFSEGASLLGQLRLVSAKGRHARVVVPAPAGRPAFSPDGRRIAYEGSGPTVRSVWTGDTARRRIITDGEEPDWSPNGRQIAFVRFGDIYTISPEGGSPTAVTHTGNAALPAWSPNGREIAFLLAGTTWELAVVEISNGSTRVLAPNPDEDTKPAWSPDGKRIAYAASSSTGEQLLTVNATNGRERVVAKKVGLPYGVSWRR